MKTSKAPRLRARIGQLMESLEPRALLSATISSYSVPDMSAFFGAYDSSGNLWVVNNSTAPSNTHQTLDKLINGAVADSIIIDGISVNDIAAGPNGHLWIADANGGLDDINTIAHTVSPHLFVTDFDNDFANVPLHLTVTTSGIIWFAGTGNAQATFTDNVIGRYNPGNDTVSFLNLNPSTNDATATFISANGADGAWVGMAGIDFGDHAGSSHLVSVAFSGSISASYYAIQTINGAPDAAIADANNPLLGVASDGTGGVWFSLANTTVSTEPHGADRIVHGVINGANLDQTAYVLPGATVGNPLTVSYLSLDASGRLWFEEGSASAAGYMDTSDHSFTVLAYPDGITFAGPVLVNAAGAQASLISYDTGDAVIQIDVEPDTVVFSGSANNLAAQERFVFNSTLLATFVAPPGTGSYSAHITWGDSTSSVVAATYLGDNTYAVVVSGKSFNSQGVYNGTISIKDSANVVAGVLNFHSTISDTPLTVTSFAVTPLLARIAVATATFTDDPGRAASSFTATINWGDSTSSNGVIVADPTQAGRYIVLAVHQYRRRGTYTAHLTVTTTESLALINSNSANSTVTV